MPLHQIHIGRVGNQGDNYVEVIVKTPIHLTDREKELFQELATLQGDKISNDDKDSLFEKLGGAFHKFMSSNKETKGHN